MNRFQNRLQLSLVRNCEKEKLSFMGVAYHSKVGTKHFIFNWIRLSSYILRSKLDS